LEKWKEEYAPSDPTDENIDDRFVHAVHHLPPLSDAIDRLLSSDPDERKAIHYTTHLTNSAGREVRGFRGIGSIISPSGYMQGGWQKVAPDDNPFKDA